MIWQVSNNETFCISTGSLERYTASHAPGNHEWACEGVERQSPGCEGPMCTGRGNAPRASGVAQPGRHREEELQSRRHSVPGCRSQKKEGSVNYLLIFSRYMTPTIKAKTMCRC